MIYKILKLWVIIALRLFYKKFSVHKPYKLPIDESLIIVANHPNTFMDPLIVASIFKQQVGFLANASIFNNRVIAKFFHYMKIVPVYRQQDVAPGVAPNNSKSFDACYKFLETHQPILLFPEGTSINELKLREIKTGASRIAFGVESRNNFELGTKIIPVGLYYSNPSKFRSKIYINVGEPIKIKEYEEDYKSDNIRGVQLLTTQIKNSLEQLTISTTDDEQEELFIKIKKIYKSHLLKKHGQGKEKSEEFRLTREISNAIQYFRISFPTKFNYLKVNIERCNQLLDTFKTPLTTHKSSWNTFSAFVLSILYILIGCPFYIYGLIQNYLPFNLPYWAAKKITTQQEYHAPIMLTIAIFIFPLYYCFSLLTFLKLTELSSIINTIYFLSLPLSGYYALHYYFFYKKKYKHIKTTLLSKSRKNTLVESDLLKQQIIKELDEARLAYLNRL